MLATRRDLRALHDSLREGLVEDMRTEARLSTIEAESQSHYKNCDERGERLERVLTDMIANQKERHAENKAMTQGLYTRWWITLCFLAGGLISLTGYLLVNGPPWRPVIRQLLP